MTVHIYGFDHYFNALTHDAIECHEKDADIALAKVTIEKQHGDMCWTLDKVTVDEEA